MCEQIWSKCVHLSWQWQICPLSFTGSYCPDNGTSQPLPCPTGWSSTAGQTSCHSCNDSSSPCGGAVVPRWSQPAHRFGQTIACRPGTYKDTREGLACVVCPVGECLSLHTAIFYYSLLCFLQKYRCIHILCLTQVITVWEVWLYLVLLGHMAPKKVCRG